MCKKHNPRKIDDCLIFLITFIKAKGGRILPIASCCGHGKYPLTIVVKNHRGHIWELLSNEIIPRKKRFYKKDKQGFYFIPEVAKLKKIRKMRQIRN